MKVLHRVSSVSLVALALTVTPGMAFAKEGFYVGLNVGSNWLEHAESGSNVAGGNNNGTLVDIDGSDGLLLGGFVGYKFSDMWRADISYTRLNNDLSWRGVFGGVASSASAYTADTTSDVFLLNAYLHGKGLFEGAFDTVDPFVGVGVGFAKNKMKNVKEASYRTGASIAAVDSDSETSTVVRLGVGVDVNVSPALTMTSSIDAYWLGDFKTGDSRDRTTAGQQDIGAWRVDDVVTYTASVGVRYSF
jgi:hypothetical protein